jgi:hypothetical protein
MQLSMTVNQLLRGISTMLGDFSNSDVFSGLGTELEELRGRLGEPLRVAVVGVMKAGKSPLMNAILKEKILYTNTLEATYTVSWFKYGDTPRLEIVFYNGETKDAPFSDLEKWTVRPKGTEKHRLDDVRYVIIYYPNEILKTMELIDTPGLESTTDEASGHTRDFLGQKLSKEADKVTAENASQAEAIIFAYSRSLDARGAAVLDAFRGVDSNSTPINAIGLFTRADTYWRHNGQSMDISPLDTVSETCKRDKLTLKDRLYTILPVTAKSVENVLDIDERTYEILTRLASVGKAVLQRFLGSEEEFMERPADKNMPVSCEDRAHVLKLFGQFGIYSITDAIAKGVPRGKLPDYMYEVSGVGTASDMIVRHFGNRAYLIKVEYILSRIKTIVNQIKHTNHTNGQVVRICELISDDIDRLREKEQLFRELEVLQSYYRGGFRIPTPELETEFLQITGEYGSSCEKRLGFDGAALVRDMRREASGRSQRWNGLANNFGVSRQMNQAAEVIARSCENIYQNLDALSGFEE